MFIKQLLLVWVLGLSFTYATACRCWNPKQVINIESYLGASDIFAFTFVSPKADTINGYAVWKIRVDTIYKQTNIVNINDALTLKIEVKVSSCSRDNPFVYGEQYLLYSRIRESVVYVDNCNRMHPIRCHNDQWKYSYWPPNYLTEPEPITFNEHKSSLAQELYFLRAMQDIKQGERLRIRTLDGISYIILTRKRFFTRIQLTDARLPEVLVSYKVNKKGRQIGKTKKRVFFAS